MFCSVPQAMPLELLAMTPPMVQAISLAGSGPSLRPCRARWALTLRTVAPGCTRTRAPPSSTSTPRKAARVSARTPSVTPWPDRLVPPERKVSGTPLSWLARNSAATSAAVRGVATDAGTSR